ncbi:MAG TPA: FtsW/RodA/SpoVE family cell cycle protein, partial [Clostridia bacterium]|nr:FtsW/RodA/SpoVE family cell cycle protein [Clostridia bacterium]
MKTYPTGKGKEGTPPLYQASPRLAYKLLSSHRHMSLTFLFICLTLVCFGLLMMFSASYGISFIQSSAGLRTQLDLAGGLDDASPVRAILEADATALARKQATLTIAGTLAAFMVGACIRFRQLTRPALGIVLYLLVTGSLIYCRFQGLVINGARRWINLGSNSFQPSELAKIGAIFFLAGYFSRRSKTRKVEMKRLADLRKTGGPGENLKGSLSRQAFFDVTLPAILIMVWVVLILIQPHLSGAVIITLI